MISKTVTKSRGSQMQAKWIEHNLKEIISDKVLRNDILEHYKPFFTGVSKNGKNVEVFELSKDVKQLTNIKL